MAKLSARGRVELARVEKTGPADSGRQVKTTLALLSDRAVLSKTTWYEADGKVDHTTGWQRWGKFKNKFVLTPDLVSRWVEQKATLGYTRV